MFGCEQFKPFEDEPVDPITDPEDTGETENTQDPDELDEDGDGYSINDGDCDDSDSSMNLDDADNDGQSKCDGDCNDEDSSVYNGADEICDGQYNDCAGDSTQTQGTPTGEDDNDDDGYFSCADDCDDNNPFIYPGAAFMDSPLIVCWMLMEMVMVQMFQAGVAIHLNSETPMAMDGTAEQI